ncbi:MAG: PorP/SprF family type IX secretion system membrane protein [Bacteroidetes bacterium]|nr:PorP/SprF family type IX secretion system membrane protein [Bacteroidota bacterium]
MKYKLIILLIATISLSTFSFAQDIHFSQFYLTPLTLNPALTGHYDADWRIMHNYRNQWNAIMPVPFQTISLGFDRQMYLHNEKFSGGIFMIYDNSGSAVLTVAKIFLSFAWHKKIGQSYLHLGIQGGPVMKSINSGNLTYPSQWSIDSRDFVSSLPSQEGSHGEQIIYPDLNFGVMWSKNLKSFKPEIGVSLFHLTMPQEAFFGGNNRLPIRSAVYAAIRIDVGKKLFFKPHLLYMGHKKATDLVGGTNFGLYLGDNRIKMRTVYIGAMVRNNFTSEMDAGIGIIGCTFDHLEIGFSYDVNVSSLHSATGYRGAFEVAIIFTSASSIIEKITVPCTRF